MPVIVDSDEDHFYTITIIGGVLWGVFYAGSIAVEDFAYACQGHAKGSIVTLPGVGSNSFAFKCTAAEIGLVVHLMCCVGYVNTEQKKPILVSWSIDYDHKYKADDAVAAGIPCIGYSCWRQGPNISLHCFCV